MTVIVGSARHDERGKYVNGKQGDNNGLEVCEQAWYLHKRGWYRFHPISDEDASAIAHYMDVACKNDGIGYDQYRHGTLILKLKSGANIATVRCDDDCSGLVRAVIFAATGVDIGSCNTSTLPAKLKASGRFEEKQNCTSASQCYTGDVLVTKSKGHTVIVVRGNQRATSPKPVQTIAVTDKQDGITYFAKKIINGEFGNGHEQRANAIYEIIRARVNYVAKNGYHSITPYDDIVMNIFSHKYGDGHETRKRNIYLEIRHKVNQLS